MAAKPRPRLADTPDVETNDAVEWLWRPAKSLKREPVEWLLKGRMAYGTLVILDGAKGVGKSTLCAALAAHVTSGVKIPSGRPKILSDVLWLTSEESYDQAVRPRLTAAGCDMARVHVPGVNERGSLHHFSFPSRLKSLREGIEQLNVALVVLDPLSSHFDPGLDLNSEGSLRPVLEAVSQLAQETGCLILGIRQLRKDRSCARVDQGLGSGSISHVARTVLAIDWPDRRQPRRLLRVVASNMGGRTGPLEYEIGEQSGSPVIQGWREVNPKDDDDDDDQIEGGERDARGDARRLLRVVLASEWVAAKTVLAEAEACGIGVRTLRSLKAELGVRSRRVGTTQPAIWEWGPPKSGW